MGGPSFSCAFPILCRTTCTWYSNEIHVRQRFRSEFRRSMPPTFHSASSKVPEDMQYLCREWPFCASSAQAFDEVADGLNYSCTGSCASRRIKNGDLRNYNGAVYRRLGLLEFDCWKGPPIIGTAKGIVPAEYFWDLDHPYTAKEVTLM